MISQTSPSIPSIPAYRCADCRAEFSPAREDAVSWLCPRCTKAHINRRPNFSIQLPDERDALLVVTAVDSDGAVGGWDVAVTDESGAPVLVKVPSAWNRELTDRAQEWVDWNAQEAGRYGERAWW